MDVKYSGPSNNYLGAEYHFFARWKPSVAKGGYRYKIVVALAARAATFFTIISIATDDKHNLLYESESS